MFNLSQSAEYAIVILASLSNAQTPLSLTEIGKGAGLPVKYLEKISARLKAGNLINSKEGKSGGYLLSKPAKSISLRSIIQAVEGKTGLVNCIYGSCSRKNSCGHKKVWLKLQKVLDQEMAKISLADFAK